jgi:F-type H+-transporting ATPase subunit epsilon
MSQAFPFELVSPEKLIASGKALSVQVPGSEGDFEVFKNHAPVMASIRPGILTVKNEAGVQRYFIDGGFADVNSSGLIVLANEAIPVEELDAARLAKGIEAAQALAAKATNDQEAFIANQKLVAFKTLQAA